MIYFIDLFYCYMNNIISLL